MNERETDATRTLALIDRAYQTILSENYMALVGAGMLAIAETLTRCEPTDPAVGEAIAKYGPELRQLRTSMEQRGINVKGDLESLFLGGVRREARTREVKEPKPKVELGESLGDYITRMIGKHDAAAVTSVREGIRAGTAKELEGCVAPLGKGYALIKGREADIEKPIKAILETRGYSFDETGKIVNLISTREILEGVIDNSQIAEVASYIFNNRERSEVLTKNSHPSGRGYRYNDTAEVRAAILELAKEGAAGLKKVVKEPSAAANRKQDDAPKKETIQTISVKAVLETIVEEEDLVRANKAVKDLYASHPVLKDNTYSTRGGGKVYRDSAEVRQAIIEIARESGLRFLADRKDRKETVSLRHILEQIIPSLNLDLAVTYVDLHARERLELADNNVKGKIYYDTREVRLAAIDLAKRGGFMETTQVRKIETPQPTTYTPRQPYVASGVLEKINVLIGPASRSQGNMPTHITMRQLNDAGVDPRFFCEEEAKRILGSAEDFARGMGYRVARVVEFVKAWEGEMGRGFRKKYPFVEKKAAQTEEPETPRIQKGKVYTLSQIMTDFHISPKVLEEHRAILGSGSLFSADKVGELIVKLAKEGK